MLGGDVGKSARLKRPGTAWKTLIQTVGLDGVDSCIALMIEGKMWPSGDGLGKACESTLRGLLGVLAVRKFSSKVLTAPSIQVALSVSLVCSTAMRDGRVVLALSTPD